MTECHATVVGWDKIGATAFTADGSSPTDMNQLFEQVEQQLGIPTVVVYNPSLRVSEPLIDLAASKVADAIALPVMSNLPINPIGFLIQMRSPKPISTYCQARSAWTWEVELRPWVEPF